MPNYRRVYIPSATYFFTVITYNRQPIFLCDESCRLLREVIAEVKRNGPFELDAFVLLPDHLHSIWTLPDNDSNFSVRWKLIKSEFSRRYKGSYKNVSNRTLSRVRKNEQAIWQRRFWDHMIRDEQDLKRHYDYLHYNPIKHGIVQDLNDWKWSTFHFYVQKNYYPHDWGKTEPLDLMKSCVGE